MKFLLASVIAWAAGVWVQVKENEMGMYLCLLAGFLSVGALSLLPSSKSSEPSALDRIWFRAPGLLQQLFVMSIVFGMIIGIPLLGDWAAKKFNPKLNEPASPYRQFR